MAKRGRMTRRRKSQKKSMRRGTRRQQGGVLVLVTARRGRRVLVQNPEMGHGIVVNELRHPIIIYN